MGLGVRAAMPRTRLASLSLTFAFSRVQGGGGLGSIAFLDLGTAATTVGNLVEAVSVLVEDEERGL